MSNKRYCSSDLVIEPEDVSTSNAVIIDCRFALSDPDLGRRSYEEGHIPGAFYLDLENDLSGDLHTHGGRHPLPNPDEFLMRLLECGIDSSTEVIVYDDSRLAFASRFWWMMKSIGYRPPKLLNGGYQEWLNRRYDFDKTKPASHSGCLDNTDRQFSGVCDIHTLRTMEFEKFSLIDSREELRYLGLEEPIDPVAGHIPGAISRPWVEVTDSLGKILSEDHQRAHWGDVLQSKQIIVHCGSGVTACVNLLSLHLLGRQDAILYAGGWSDWCSYL